ncbi:MAG TPA: hypothetical protein VJH23_00345 [archaeon]|nr:hypothetical protein [archaeon]
MKAVFEVRTIESDWKPPFKKNNYANEYVVADGEAFDRIMGNGNDEPVFELMETAGDRAKVKYSRLFTIKEPSERVGKDKTVWLIRGDEQPLSYLWGEKGITKKIVYKGIASREQESVQEQAEEIVEITEPPSQENGQ